LRVFESVRQFLSRFGIVKLFDGVFLPELIDFLFEGIEFADFAVNFHIKHLSFGDFLEDLFELAFEHINILKPYVFIGGFSIEKVIFSDLTGFI
jgi:hypothetical protein